MTEFIDPELRDDRDESVEDLEEIQLPEYDPSQFVPSDDFEFIDDDEEEDEE